MSPQQRDVPLVVAIDGPSGSGKSSVSRQVAARLGVGYLDTGAMYRAVTWDCLQQGLDLNDQAVVTAAAQACDLRMGTDPLAPTVHVGEHDVAEAIRSTAISEQVSAVATNQGVRSELIRRQREIISQLSATAAGGCVAEGRDITTVVAPDAVARVLLTASQEARMARRARDVHGDDSAEAVQSMHAQVVARDVKDSTVAQFLEAADGVHVVDTSDLNFEESIAAVLHVVTHCISEHAADSDAAAVSR